MSNLTIEEKSNTTYSPGVLICSFPST